MYYKGMGKKKIVNVYFRAGYNVGNLGLEGFETQLHCLGGTANLSSRLRRGVMNMA